jgi:hypothetical protein
MLHEWPGLLQRHVLRSSGDLLRRQVLSGRFLLLRRQVREDQAVHKHSLHTSISSSSRRAGRALLAENRTGLGCGVK